MTETLTTAAPLAIDDATADLLFRTARSVTDWAEGDVSDQQLQAAWDLAKFGPTAMNIQPLRFAVVRSAEAKARLIPLMAETNQPKVAAAPVTLVLANDPAFHEHMDRTFPIYPGMKEQLAPAAEARGDMARSNAFLQAGFLIVALRSVGLSVRPMNGMDFEAVDKEFFGDSGRRSFMVINVGIAEGAGTRHPRLPRLDIDEVADFH